MQEFGAETAYNIDLYTKKYNIINMVGIHGLNN